MDRVPVIAGSFSEFCVWLKARHLNPCLYEYIWKPSTLTQYLRHRPMLLLGKEYVKNPVYIACKDRLHIDYVLVKVVENNGRY
jgi:hypothetical protein